MSAGVISYLRPIFVVPLHQEKNSMQFRKIIFMYLRFSMKHFFFVHHLPMAIKLTFILFTFIINRIVFFKFKIVKSISLVKLSGTLGRRWSIVPLFRETNVRRRSATVNIQPSLIDSVNGENEWLEITDSRQQRTPVVG